MVALVMSVHSSASFPDGTAKLSSENVFGWFNMPKVRRFSERITALQFIKTSAPLPVIFQSSAENLGSRCTCRLATRLDSYATVQEPKTMSLICLRFVLGR